MMLTWVNPVRLTNQSESHFGAHLSFTCLELIEIDLENWRLDLENLRLDLPTGVQTCEGGLQNWMD